MGKLYKDYLRVVMGILGIQFLDPPKGLETPEGPGGPQGPSQKIRQPRQSLELGFRVMAVETTIMSLYRDCIGYKLGLCKDYLGIV